jgi:hypothetical protein
MRALTIWQPWASLIVGAPPSYDEHETPPQKPIENRPWCPRRGLVGQRVAIHAGKVLNENVLETFYDLFKAKVYGEVRAPYAKPSLFPRGAVVGVARLVAVVVRRKGAIVDAFGKDGIPEVDIGEDGRRFYGNDVGWLFREQRYLRRPVPCSGAQGVWRLPPEVALDVQEQLR